MTRRTITLIAAAAIWLTLGGCGGAGIAPAENTGQRIESASHSGTDPAHDLTSGTLRAWAWVGSPVDPRAAYINSRATEPGEVWLGNWRSPSGLATAQTRRYIPFVEFRYSMRLTDEQKKQIEAATRRAFKLWTRHLEGDLRIGKPYDWGRYVVQVGTSCGSATAIACAREASGARPATIHIPRETAVAMAGGVSIAMLGTLAHEVGHALGYDNDIRQAGIQPHADPGTKQLMAPHQGDSNSIAPQAADLAGLRRTFLYAEDAAGHDAFGWWEIVDPENSALLLYGVKVIRTLSVDDDITAVALLEGVRANALTSDSIHIGAFVDGVPTAGSYVRGNLGGATWKGRLLAADHEPSTGYAPVIGDALLRARLDEQELWAKFDDLVMSNGSRLVRWRGPPRLEYLLKPVDGPGLWADDGGRVDAAFFAVKTLTGGADPTAYVAGHLHDEAVGLTGAYAAARTTP